MAMPDLQRYPYNLCLIKYDIHVFGSLNCLFSFAVSLRKWLGHSCFRKAAEKLELSTVRVRKTTVSSTFLIRLWFQGYHCKSGIVIFQMRVIWNYFYSPFAVQPRGWARKWRKIVGLNIERMKIRNGKLYI